jgi:predicted MPP superfamily phosphohydrolase
MSTDPKGLDLILLVGDLSYANSDQPKWDTWGRIYEYLAATTPWMLLPGNHENEEYFLPGAGFIAYQARFKMPSASDDPAQRNLYWSMDYSWAHLIALSTESDYTETSEQYAWFVKDIESFDRRATPWLIVMFHRPYYNSNYGKLQITMGLC